MNPPPLTPVCTTTVEVCPFFTDRTVLIPPVVVMAVVGTRSTFALLAVVITTVAVWPSRIVLGGLARVIVVG